MPAINMVQGGREVSAWVHDCGSVCYNRSDIAGPPYPPYLVYQVWCPNCDVFVDEARGRVVDASAATPRT